MKAPALPTPEIVDVKRVDHLPLVGARLRELAVKDTLDALITDTTGGRKEEAELYRLKGELLWQAGTSSEEAAPCFQQALAIACRQQAKSLELRAAMSLVRLWRQQGKWDEARELLAPIYRWFTEGVDTVDLQEAKALWDELF
jgi:predicted ATPase